MKTRQFRKIMIATDGSRSAGRALAIAIALAEGAELQIVTVVPPIERASLKVRGRLRGDAIAAAPDDETETILQAAMTRAKAGRAEKIVTDALYGDEADAILKEAKQRKPDLIVVGRRGHGTLMRLLVGSVSSKIVALSPYPVLVVP